MRTTVLAALLAATAALGATLPAGAGLRAWSVVYLDGKGKPVTYGKHKSAEIWSEDTRGWQVGIGCEGGGLSMHVTAPKGEQADFAGPEIEPLVRIGRPGTDMFAGPIEKMHFDGTRYNGPMPREILDAILYDADNKQLTFTVLKTHTNVRLPLQRMERVVNELHCK